MKLKVKTLKLFAGRPVAILQKNLARRLNIHVDERIMIQSGKKQVIAILDISAPALLNQNEIVLSEEVIKSLSIKSGSYVEIMTCERPKSTEYIREKIKGKELSEEKIFAIISDIVCNKLTEAEIAYFVSGVYINRMSMDETYSLIKAIVNTGQKLKINGQIIADKHSIGGIAGNRTTPVIVSICSAAGLTMPKTSSRAITSAAGTADTIETITKVEFSMNQIKNIVKKVNACMVWGGSLGLAPADDKIIQIEKLLSIDPESQLIASILSKKIAAGATHVVLDIPCGKSAKFGKEEAVELGKKFSYFASKFGLKVKIYISKGSEPIGHGIGPVLEMQDVIAVLSQKEERPLDLEQKTLDLSGVILEMTGKAKKGEGKKMASSILKSGKAYEKFKQIISAQNGWKEYSQKEVEKRLLLGEYKYDVLSKKKGHIKEIDNKKMNSIAKIAGCPADKGAGIYLYKHCGDCINLDEPLMTIYSETKERLEYAKKKFEESQPIVIVS
ncbi:MAG: AMP phosphorylase [archaeon]